MRSKEEIIKEIDTIEQLYRLTKTEKAKNIYLGRIQALNWLMDTAK